MRLRSHQRVNTQIKQEAEGKPTAVSLPARFFPLLLLELVRSGVGNRHLRSSASHPRAPQSCEPAWAEGHDIAGMEAVFLIPSIASRAAQVSPPSQGRV